MADAPFLGFAGMEGREPDASAPGATEAGLGSCSLREGGTATCRQVHRLLDLPFRGAGVTSKTNLNTSGQLVLGHMITISGHFRHAVSVTSACVP